MEKIDPKDLPRLAGILISPDIPRDVILARYQVIEIREAGKPVRNEKGKIVWIIRPSIDLLRTEVEPRYQLVELVMGSIYNGHNSDDRKDCAKYRPPNEKRPCLAFSYNLSAAVDIGPEVRAEFERMFPQFFWYLAG